MNLNLVMDDDQEYGTQLRLIQPKMTFKCKKGYNTFTFYKKISDEIRKLKRIKRAIINYRINL